jgi:hypothetical protein
LPIEAREITQLEKRISELFGLSWWERVPGGMQGGTVGSRLSLAIVGLFAATAPALAQQPTPAPQPAPPPLEQEPATETAAVAGPMAEPMATPAPPAPPAEPIVVGSGVSNANLGMLLASGLGLGAGIGLFVAAHGDASDADEARTFDDHDRLESRSRNLYILSAISAGAGVALGAVAMFRIRAAAEHNTTVSLSPRKGGASFVLEGTW